MIEYQSLFCYRMYSYDVGEQKSNSKTGQYSNLYICNANLTLVAVTYFGYEFNIIIEFCSDRYHSLVAGSCARSSVGDFHF
jgi:hypothetical protein